MSVSELPSGGWRASAIRWRSRLAGRRRRSNILAWAVLCAALVAVGVTVATVTTGRIEAPALVDPGSAGRKGAAARPADEGVRGDAPTSLITKGITVQVLNGTSRGKADDRMVKRLEGVGLDVVAVHPSAVRYRRTAVMWSDGEDREAAEALARHFGWGAERKPRNLSGSVSLHVVVGRDESTS
ncbi:MAG TPA: LytR C-terminal domain-containing protein [Actinomycetota bacterium]|nr:LytR C-terminal domain-containing protein [Actinomycetota bacterium]